MYTITTTTVYVLDNGEWDVQSTTSTPVADLVDVLYTVRLMRQRSTTLSCTWDMVNVTP